MDGSQRFGISRRAAAVAFAAAVSELAVHGPLFAQSQKAGELPPTPRQSEGPFYPLSWAGDADSDLVMVKGEAARALGQVTLVSGRIVDSFGRPIEGARVEIWQCDSRGIYLHPADRRPSQKRDQGFQGRGRTATGNDGAYAFRTIRPVPYGGRAPHIHFAIEAAGRPRLVTQMYVAGEPLNESDFLLSAIRDRRQRDSIIVKLETADRLEQGALAGSFDVVLAS